MGTTSSSQDSALTTQRPDKPMRPPAPRYPRKPIYLVEQLAGLLNDHEALKTLSSPLLAIIAEYCGQEKPAVMPELTLPIKQYPGEPVSPPPDAIRVRIVLVGAACSGKTALMQSFSGVPYNEVTIGMQTMGCDLNRVHFALGSTHVDLQIWDTRGSSSLFLNKTLYRFQMLGVLVLFDSGNRSTFDAIKTRILPELMQLVEPADAPLMLCANSWRNPFRNHWQRPREVTTEQAEALAVEQDMDYAECDKENKPSVLRVFAALAYRVLCLRQPALFQPSSSLATTAADSKGHSAKTQLS